MGYAVEAAVGGDFGDGFFCGDQLFFRVTDARGDEIVPEGLAGDALETAGEIAVA